MKITKRLLTIILCLSMLVSLMPSVFAVETYEAPTSLGDKEIMVSVMDTVATEDNTVSGVPTGKKAYDADMTIRFTYKNTAHIGIHTITGVLHLPKNEMYPYPPYAKTDMDTNLTNAYTGLVTGPVGQRIYKPENSEGSYYEIRDVFNLSTSTPVRVGTTDMSYVEVTYHFDNLISTEGQRIPITFEGYKNNSGVLQSKLLNTDLLGDPATAVISDNNANPAFTGYIITRAAQHSVTFTDGNGGNVIPPVQIEEGNKIPQSDFDDADDAYTPPENKELLGWEDENGNLVDPDTPITENKILTPVIGDHIDKEDGKDSIKANDFSYGLDEGIISLVKIFNLSQLKSWDPDNTPYTTMTLLMINSYPNPVLTTQLNNINADINNKVIKAGDTRTIELYSGNSVTNKRKTALVEITFKDNGSDQQETQDDPQPHITSDYFEWPISNGPLDDDIVKNNANPTVTTPPDGLTVPNPVLDYDDTDLSNINQAIAAGDPINPATNTPLWPVKITYTDPEGNLHTTTTVVELTTTTIKIEDENGNFIDIIKIMRTADGGVTDPDLSSEPYSFATTSREVSIDLDGNPATEAEVDTILAGMTYEVFDPATEEFVAAPSGFSLNLAKKGGVGNENVIVVKSRYSQIIRMTSHIYGGTFQMMVLVPGDVNLDGLLDADDWVDVLRFVNDGTVPSFKEYTYTKEGTTYNFWDCMADMDNTSLESSVMTLDADDWVLILRVVNDGF